MWQMDIVEDIDVCIGWNGDRSVYNMVQKSCKITRMFKRRTCLSVDHLLKIYCALIL